MSKHAKEGELNMVKVIGAIIIVIAIVATIVYFATRGSKVENEVEKTELTDDATTKVEITEVPSEQPTLDDGVGKIVPPSSDDPIVNPADNRTDSENKAVELAEKYRGEDDSVYYTIDSKNGDIYNVVARNKETTAAVMFYTVNVATGDVTEQ